MEIEFGEQLVVKSIVGGQMVLFKEKQCELPLCETPPKLSLLNMHNFISEFNLTVRKEMYNRSLRLKKVAHHGSIDDNNNNNNKRFIPRQYPTVQRRLQEKNLKINT